MWKKEKKEMGGGRERRELNYMTHVFRICNKWKFFYLYEGTLYNIIIFRSNSLLDIVKMYISFLVYVFIFLKE